MEVDTKRIKWNQGGECFGILFTPLFHPHMTHAGSDFIWLLMEMRPHPNSWPPSTRQKDKMWVIQLQLRPIALQPRPLHRLLEYGF